MDAKELEEALDVIEQKPRGRYADILIAAARAHLTTLPRWKDVEVERWVLFNRAGRQGPFSYECAEEAEEALTHECYEGWNVVKLTGTARVKV
tara:strand:- start:10883 stop:11161 length:279 start_codon:yes stop_codon:yes gene_type:complete